MKFKRSKDSGQISIMLAMLMMTFIIFFAFVINISMLVNAKINVQNAADLAAYAGAAVQARQLTQIGHLNYEMRRQYKKFIFRYYVIGNMAQKTMGQATGPRNWSPDGATSYGAPAVCMIFDPKDNICQLARLAAISIPPKSAMDSINDTLISSLKEIESLRQKNCKSSGILNKQVLLFWLWNTEPSLQTMIRAVQSNVVLNQEFGKILTLLTGVNYGLGIIPKEILLRERIRTLNDYVNVPAKTGVKFDSIRDLMVDVDAPQHERTVNAFYSAYRTLGNHTFDDPDNITMDELLPGGSDYTELLRLKDFTVKFDTFYMDFQTATNGNTLSNAQNPPADCIGTPVKMQVNFPLPMGVTKDTAIVTYYAIRLKAKAKLMFSPFGDLTLKAYAAARPFGSRLGPLTAPTEDNLTWKSSGPAAGTIPGLPIIGNAANEWADMTNMQEYYKFMMGQSGGNITSAAAMETAYTVAMAPTLAEVKPPNQYNIPNDFWDEYFVMVNPKDNYYRFWAPVISKKKEAATGGDVSAMVRNLLQAALSSGGIGGTQILLNDALVTGMTRYISDLKSGKGEFSESYSFAAISNPMKYTPLGGGAPKPMPLSPRISANTEKLLKTSWKSKKDSDPNAGGRTAYSVKIIAMKEILQKEIKGEGGAQMTNVMSIDGESDVDLNGPFEH